MTKLLKSNWGRQECRLCFRLCRFSRIRNPRTDDFAAAWITQRQQANVQWLLQEKTRPQELYQQFMVASFSLKPRRRAPVEFSFAGNLASWVWANISCGYDRMEGW